jgi:hypothetical protein
MDDREVKLRCIEAAAKTPMVHLGGQSAGVIEVATAWFDWINSGATEMPSKKPLGLPRK